MQCIEPSGAANVVHPALGQQISRRVYQSMLYRSKNVRRAVDKARFAGRRLPQNIRMRGVAQATTSRKSQFRSLGRSKDWAVRKQNTQTTTSASKSRVKHRSKTVDLGTGDGIYFASKFPDRFTSTLVYPLSPRPSQRQCWDRLVVFSRAHYRINFASAATASYLNIEPGGLGGNAHIRTFGFVHSIFGGGMQWLSLAKYVPSPVWIYMFFIWIYLFF